MAFQKLGDDLFVWTDTCNVYAIKDGDAALLIDLGDGSVLDHLGEIGVTRAEWVLFTHHHREQCQGADRVDRDATKLAAPEAERAFFERPANFRRMSPALDDAFTVYGSSYLRPPIRPIRLDRTFQKMDSFTWRGREFWCLGTPGNSPGSMSYLLHRPEGWLAFGGDVMRDGARMDTWFDTEWDYGFAKGLYALHDSAGLLERFEPAALLPSHGPVVRDAAGQLADYRRKLRELARHYLRGYELFTFAAADQDRVSRPTAVPHVWQVSPHLFKFKGHDFWPNFTLLLSDSGHGLLVDCGLLDHAFLDRALALMGERIGLKQVDAIVVTHMHGDHYREAPHVRDKHGAQLWTLDRVADKCQFPERFDYVAPLKAYRSGVESVAYDRLFRDGETFRWREYDLTVDWMPGQTEFALCLHGRVDGRHVAFTGDNLFASTTDPAQHGHEAVVARNSGILEEGYLYAAEYLTRLQPDLILGGHSWVMDQPRDLIARYLASARALRSAFRALSADDDYRYMFDPYWIRAEPYRNRAHAGQRVEVGLVVRNFRDRPQEHQITVHAPEGIAPSPTSLRGKVRPESRCQFPLWLDLAPDVKPGVYAVAFDVTLDGHRYGQYFDLLIEVAAS